MNTGQTSQTERQPTPSPRPAAPLAHADGPAAELRAFFVQLLQDQCSLVGGLVGVVYLAQTRGRSAGIAARYVADAAAQPGGVGLTPDLLGRLEGVGRRIAEADHPSGVAENLTLPDAGGIYGAGPAHRVLACPLIAEGRVEGACVLVAAAANASNTQDDLDTLALTTARFEAFLWRQHCLSEAAQKARLRETLELLDTAQQGENAGAMASLMCHELAHRFGCTRVSIGLVHRGRLRLTAVSGADDIDRKGAAVEAIEQAMEECADQDIEVVYPVPAEHESDPAQRRVTRAHEQLSRGFGPAAIVSLPLRVEGDLVGVVCLEREPTDPFPAASVPLLRLISEFIGPAVWTRRLADRGVLAVVRDRTIELGEVMVGPRHTGAKLLVLVAIVALVLLSLVPIPARVKAGAQIKASVSRVVVPPFAGYLSEALVRPGDAVAEGDVLAKMDSTDLALELTEFQSRRASLETERDNAEAEGDAGRVRALDAAIDEITATIELRRSQIERAVIRSPITGIIGQGDLEQVVGAHVDPTQPLFEIVTSKRVVQLEIGERDVARLIEHRRRLEERDKPLDGRLVIKARPGKTIAVRLLGVNPMAEVVERGNVYLGEAELLEGAPWLRPGMTGSVKLDAGWTTGLVKILRPIIDEARYRFWW